MDAKAALRLVITTLAWAALSPAVGTSAEPAATKSETFSPEQLAAFKSLDDAIARFDADLARVSDIGQRARVEVVLDAFKARRNALRQQRFDQVRYDELRFDLNVEYQRLGRYLAPPITKPPPGEPAAAAPIEVPDLRLILRPIPAGTFVMGRPAGTPGAAPDESPETRVTVSQPFWLGATEVTIDQWKKFAEATGHRLGSDARGSSGDPERPPNQPVIGVSWKDAQAFCAWLTRRERSAGRLPAGYVYTLPTEAQWEYACRAGNRGPDLENLDEWAWHAGNSGGELHAVGTRRPNVWGLYDMQGNVEEWCLDHCGTYPGGLVTDLRGPPDGTAHAVRGGSAKSAVGKELSSTHRGASPDSGRRDDLGFRVALTPAKP